MLDWDLVSSPAESTGRAICYSPTLDRWVCLGEFAMYSDDGINWVTGTAADYPSVTNYVNRNGIIWHENLQLFIAVCRDNNFVNDTHILTSPDGETWTTRTGDGVPLLSQVAYEPVTGLCVIVGANGGALTSPDGVTWSANTDLVGVDAAADWTGVTWFPFAGLFVAVANNGDVRIATSPDGLNWTGRHGFEPNYQRTWAYVAAHPTQDLIFACAGSNGRYFMRSEDGITWETPYIIPIISPGFFNVETYITFWSETLDKIILLVDDDISEEGQVLVNPDGAEANWELDSVVPDTIVSSGSSWEWQALAENPTEGRFVAGQENPSDQPFATALDGIPDELDLEITDGSILSLSPADMIGDLHLEVAIVNEYQIIGDLHLEIELDPVLVMSADASGIYTFIPGQRFDRMLTRNEDTDETLDVMIPNQFGKTGYFGG